MKGCAMSIHDEDLRPLFRDMMRYLNNEGYRIRCDAYDRKMGELKASQDASAGGQLQTTTAPLAPESADDAPDRETREAADFAGPEPLTTGNIAFCFSGLRWDEARWKKPLGDKPKWLQACIVTPARRGISETRWNPVSIGAALVQREHVKARNVRAKFQTQPLLKPWCEAWKTYEADNFDKD